MNESQKAVKIENYLTFANKLLIEGDSNSASAVALAILEVDQSCAQAWHIFLDSELTNCKKLGFLKQWARVGMFLFAYSAYQFSRGEQMKWVTKMLKARPGSILGLKLLSKTAKACGKTELQLLAKELILKRLPECEETGLGLVENYLTMHRFQDAINLGEAILHRNPGSARALNLVHQAAVDDVMSRGLDLDSENRAKAFP